MRLADGTNAPGEMAYATFLSAIAVLEFDRSELDRLMDDYSDDSLLEAAMMTGSHVEDMRSLREEQADMFARFHGDPQSLEYDQRAHYMIASLMDASMHDESAFLEQDDEQVALAVQLMTNGHADLKELAARISATGKGREQEMMPHLIPQLPISLAQLGRPGVGYSEAEGFEPLTFCMPSCSKASGTVGGSRTESPRQRE